MITIVDYGVGNLASIKNMLSRSGIEAIISENQADLLSASHLILPGVGAFDTCAEKLRDSGLIETLNKKVLLDKTPILGVCVGLQLILEKSEEGKMPGLGWVKGSVIKFSTVQLPFGTKIPHMGWADVVLNKSSELFSSMPQDPRFYFVHSYHAQLLDESDALLYANYGYRFVAGVERGNIMGVQFHPEKSHKYGMKMLVNFCTRYS